MNPGDTVVMDCGSQIFTRPGLASVPEAALASVQPSTEALLEQLMHNRVPAPAVLRLHQVCRAALISIHLVHSVLTGCLPAMYSVHFVLTGCLPGLTSCTVFYSHIPLHLLKCQCVVQGSLIRSATLGHPQTLH